MIIDENNKESYSKSIQSRLQNRIKKIKSHNKTINM